MELSLFLGLLSKASIPMAIFLLLSFCVYMFFIIYQKQNDNNQKFIKKVMDDGKEREIKILGQVDKYNTALENNNRILDKISNKLEDVKILKEDVRLIKTKLEL